MNQNRDPEIQQCIVELTELARDETQHKRKDAVIPVRAAKNPKINRFGYLKKK